MPTTLSIYSDNMDWLRKEFKLSQTTSLYEIVNILTDKYKELKNQSKEIEDDRTKKGKSRKGSG